MAFVVFLQLVAIFSLVGCTYGYGTGAPETACVTQMPGHSVAAQTTANPYMITVSSNISISQPITVTVSGTFQGLLLQARSTGSSTTPIGVFSSAPTDTKVVKCTADADSWTHSSTTSKTDVTITWTPPSTFSGDIVFQATVAASKNVFWMNTLSSSVSVLSNDENNGGRVTAGIMIVLAPLLLLCV